MILPLLLALQAASSAAPGDNAEMTRLFDADQADRGAPMTPATMNGIATRDFERRTRTRVLLDGGKLATGDDYYHAAFVFQHGDAPADYLLAHSLAVAAAAKGQKEAAWSAAASLDRWLQAMGQPQVYGTQFRWLGTGPVTQEPYDRAAVSDGLRAAMGVPLLADQEKRRAAIDAERSAAK